MKLEGNTVLITGGGSGIGRGLAEAFHKRGNQVIIAGRRREVLERTAAANRGMGVVVMDTTKPDTIRDAAAAAIRRYPALNVVINNAGVQRVVDFAAETPPDETAIREEIETNIYGVLRVIAAFLPHLKSKTESTIVNISSGLAFLPIARFPVYCATKAYLHSFTMSLRHQLRNTSVKVVELAPPWVKTDLDAAHGGPTEHEGMSPMPLADFILAAMLELSSDAEELPVAGAKFLYNAGVSNQAAAIFEQINR
jgi:uncharacterized oxidoreductase